MSRRQAIRSSAISSTRLFSERSGSNEVEDVAATAVNAIASSG
jgi:hypothetical protein